MVKKNMTKQKSLPSHLSIKAQVLGSRIGRRVGEGKEMERLFKATLRKCQRALKDRVGKAYTKASLTDKQNLEDACWRAAAKVIARKVKE